MTSSLIPEKPLTISPSLAATIGLEEAVMLQALHERMTFSKSTIKDGYKWFTFEQAQLEETFPFWQAGDVQRVASSLRDKGVLLLSTDNYLVSKALDVALNEKVVASVVRSEIAKPKSAAPPLPTTVVPVADTSSPKPSTKVPTIKTALGAQKMMADWQPNAETIKEIKRLGIPAGFINETVPEFIAYWQERDEAHHGWNAKFRTRVVERWRKEETLFAAQQDAAHLPDAWRPSEDAYEVLDRAGVDRNFIDEAVPEFVLYWREKGESSATWNSKFVQHVRRQWDKYSHSLQHDTAPRMILENWQPSADVFDILQMANIDNDFAKKLIPEFVLYWRESKQLHTSWNSKFLQHVKYHWAKSLSPSNQHAKTAEQDFVSLHTNKSWREGL